jgi:hypothetical protein
MPQRVRELGNHYVIDAYTQLLATDALKRTTPTVAPSRLLARACDGLSRFTHNRLEPWNNERCRKTSMKVTGVR